MTTAQPASVARGRQRRLATPPDVWPEVAARDDFTNLLVLLRHAREGCWAFAIYNHAAVREQAVQALTTLLAPLPVYQWTYSLHDPFPYGYLERMPEQARSERAVVFLFDFERAGAEVWKALDYNRELFSAHPHGLVFWVTPPGRGQAARQAPHFWAQRSGVFDFTVENPPALERVQPLVRQEISFGNLEETQRQLRLYQGLLEDLEGQPDAPPRFLADLHLKVARLARYVDQVPLARRHAQAALEIADGLDDTRLHADSVKALGDVHLEEDNEAAALAAYQDAFERYIALGLPDAAAGALTSQASIYNRRKEYALSLPLYTQAIELAPANPIWYRNRALCYINLKDSEHALSDLEMAARLQPDHPYRHLRRGDVAMLQKDYGAAAGHYAAFIGVLPLNNAGHFGLAQAYFGQRRTEEALASLRRALELTYSRQEVIDALDELAEMQGDQPDLPGIEQGMALLREWLASHSDPARR